MLAVPKEPLLLTEILSHRGDKQKVTEESGAALEHADGKNGYGALLIAPGYSRPLAETSQHAGPVVSTSGI